MKPSSPAPIDQSLPPVRPCMVCHALVCVRLWHHKGGIQPGPWWEELPRPVSPVMGLEHRCGAEGRDC